MNESWLNLSRRAGDAHLGQTLVRLAGLAAAAQRFAAGRPEVFSISGQVGIEPLDPQAATPQARKDAGAAPAVLLPPVRTEVDR